MHRRTIQYVILIIIAVSLMTNTYAVGPGFYLGFMTGPASNNGPNQVARSQNCLFTVTAKPKSKMWGTRVYMGYQFTHWAGAELGLFSYFSGIHYSVPQNFTACSGLSDRIRDIDLVGKFSVPFQDCFDIYVKAGVAIVYQTLSGAFTSCRRAPCTVPPCKKKNCSAGCITPCSPIDSKCVTCGQSKNTTNYRPTFSLGASYNISQSWLADISYNRISAGGGAGNVDFLAIGLSYHLVDVYCGQFLC